VLYEFTIDIDINSAGGLKSGDWQDMLCLGPCHLGTTFVAA